MKPHNLFKFALIIGLGTGVYFLAKETTFAVFAQSAVEVTEFTAEQTMRDSAGQVTSRKTTARRRDGSEVLVLHPPGLPSVRRVDHSDGRIGMFFDHIQGKSTGFARQTDIAFRKESLRNPPNQCSQNPENQVEAGEVLMGLDTWKVTRTSPAGTKITEWLAPQLQCFALRMRSESPDGSMETEFLTLEAPSDILFDMGGGYSEMSPATLQQAVNRSLGLPTDSTGSPMNAQAEAAYFRQQTR